MVARIITGKSIQGVLNYNEHKVREGKAELLLASRFLQEPEELTFRDKLGRFERLLEKSPQVKTNTLHISLNFDVGEQLEQERLKAIAMRYMEKIGFGKQPYLVYRHHDAAHPHLHIVTTNIRPDGSRIDLHNIGRLRSEPARKSIELEYSLVKAENKKQIPALSLEPLRLRKVVYGKAETKRSIAAVVSAVTSQYNYTSLAELNAVLRHFGVTADLGSEHAQMRCKKGLVYSIVNDKGGKQGVPLKASALPGKPTLAYLEKRFEKNKLCRRPLQLSLRSSIDKIFRRHPIDNREIFNRLLAQQDIQVVFRENRQGLTYGVTYIDHRHKAVFNGSELGKAYSAKALLERFNQGGQQPQKALVVKQQEPTNRTLGKASGQAPQQESLPQQKPNTPGLLELLFKAEQADQLTDTFRRKRKKRRRKPKL